MVLEPTATAALRYAPKSGLEVEIGDVLQQQFYPQAKIKRWNNECNLSFRLNLPGGGRETVTTAEGSSKVVWEKGDYRAVFYHLNQGEDGALEFEIHLGKKPPSNSFSFSYTSKGVGFYYQPALTAEEIAAGHIRPDNVVGSYAVYAIGRRHNQYQTGKVCHIYRPHAVDAAGRETWGDISISAPDANGNGTVTLSLPQAWLNSATYPVVVDPTFGYSAVGASSATVTSQYMILAEGTPSASGEVDAIHLYGSNSFAYGKGVIVQKSDKLIVANGVSDYVNYGASPGWNTMTFGATKPAVTGGVAHWVGVVTFSAHTGYYDSGGTNSSAIDYTNSYTTPTDPTDLFLENLFRSIYADFTESAAPSGGFMTLNTGFWG